MFSGIKIAMVLLVLAGAGGGFMYVKNLQKNLAISEANNAKLEQSIESQKAVIEQQLKDMKAIQEANKEQQELVNRLNKSFDDLKDKFNKVNASGKKRDMGNLAVKKPKLIEKIINKGTENAQRCIEIASGAKLTEKELNAKKKSEINPECPDIANPNYIPYAN
jgi:multidrug resistance efflux pump